MDYKNIKDLIKTVSDSQLTCFEIETEGIKIKMEKQKEVVTVTSQNESVKVNSHKITNDSEKEMLLDNIKDDLDDNVEIIKSPIVGTFYNSPAPDKPAFVQLGDKVKKGDILCIIEAMKLMNNIDAEVNGEIVEILVENEDMVEYGQPLFRIKK